MDPSNTDMLDQAVKKLSLQDQAATTCTTASTTTEDTTTADTTTDTQVDIMVAATNAHATMTGTAQAMGRSRRQRTTGKAMEAMIGNTSTPTTHRYPTRSKAVLETNGQATTAQAVITPHLRKRQTTPTATQTNDDNSAATTANNRQNTRVPYFQPSFPQNGNSESSTLNPTIAKAPDATKNNRTARRREKELEDLISAAQNGPNPPAPRSPRSKAAPYLHMLKRPTPNKAYMHKAEQLPQVLDSPRPLLVILDLNGTLLFRKKFGGSNAFIPRPHVHAFLEYLLSNHMVMVWSSARPENVAKMCFDLFTEDQRAQLVAVWARDKLHLSTKAFNEKCQVYKQLSWVWKDATIGGKSSWSQADTVLIDDSTEKVASEPYNLVRIDEFEAKPEQMTMDVLGQVTQYLQQLQRQSDVSAYMRTQPFQYVPGVATQ